MTVVSYKPNYSSAVSNASYPLRQYVNNGITFGEMSMPKKFRGADNETSFSLGRAVYIKSGHVKKSQKPKISQNSVLTDLLLLKNTVQVSKKNVNTDSSSQYIDRLKNIAIGSGSIKTNETSEHSFKSQNNANRNTIRTALRKARSLGYVPPKKAAHR